MKQKPEGKTWELMEVQPHGKGGQAHRVENVERGQEKYHKGVEENCAVGK